MVPKYPTPRLESRNNKMGVRELQALASAPAASDPAEEKARQDRAKAPPPQQQTKGSLDQYRVGAAPPKKAAPPESWADEALAKRVASVRASADGSTFTVLKDLEAALRDRTAALASLPRLSQVPSVTNAVAIASGTKKPDTRSASRCTSARLPWA